MSTTTKKKTSGPAAAVAKIRIHWHLDLPEAAERVFLLDERRSWKGKLIRGYDIAEMISQDIWDAESQVVVRLHITAPAEFSGMYDISTQFQPLFSAKRVDI